jgi:signal peptidase II
MLTVLANKGNLPRNSSMINYLKQPSLVFLAIFISIMIVLDQLTKYMASSMLVYGEPIRIFEVLNMTLLHNHGAAFSFLSDQGGWQRWLFMGISTVASICFIVWLVRLPKEVWLTRYSLAFIIAGAIGNLIDRVYLGYVVDFISVHWRDNYFPAFNLADSAITVGAFLMILDILFNPENHK